MGARGEVRSELSTGLDRQEFPTRPPEEKPPRGRCVRFELNEILLRTGDPVLLAPQG